VAGRSGAGGAVREAGPMAGAGGRRGWQRRLPGAAPVPLYLVARCRRI